MTKPPIKQAPVIYAKSRDNELLAQGVVPAAKAPATHAPVKHHGKARTFRKTGKFA